jgi:Rrf2 family protein
MASVLRISSAASIALHAVVLLAANPDKLLSTRDIASTLGVSEAHLSKVLQRLVKAGLARATRGPRGGFEIEDDTDDVTLLHVFEEIEGPLRPDDCLLSSPICGGDKCIFGDLIKRLNREVSNYLAETTIADVVHAYFDVRV